MDIRKYHYLQCSILAFLPWYFDPQKGITELEMDLIKSLREKSSEKYEDCIEKFAEQYDFKTARIKKLLSGFETRFERQECEKSRNTIRSIDNEIDRLNSTIAQRLRQRHDQEIRLLGLESRISKCDGESEIMEYFLSNDKISLITAADLRMDFVAKGYLEFFDDELAKTVIENDSSYIYSPGGRDGNNVIPHDDMRLLMDAIFLKQTIKVRVCAAYTFELGYQVSAHSHYRYGPEFKDCTPNPHIDGFGCMGNYIARVNQLIKDDNYIMALEQCVASCKSLNFADITVMSEFMSRLYGFSDYSVNIRCIELPNGMVVKPKEAIEYLKSGGTENEQTN